MKRIYLLMILMVGLATSTFAQRTINARLQHVFKETSSASYAQFKTSDTLLINGEKSYYYGWNITNYGPDTTIMGDSLKVLSTWGTRYRYGYNGNYTGVDSSILITPTANPITLNPGSGITMSGYQSINWCDSLWIIDQSGAVIKDDTLSNNLACTNLTVLYWLLSVDGELKTDKEAFMMYPNPATSKMNIKYNFGTNNKAQVRVIDVTGKTVHAQDLGTLNGVQDVQLNLPHMSTGVYVVQLVTNDRTLTKQLYIK